MKTYVVLFVAGLLVFGLGNSAFGNPGGGYAVLGICDNPPEPVAGEPLTGTFTISRDTCQVAAPDKTQTNYTVHLVLEGNKQKHLLLFKPSVSGSLCDMSDADIKAASNRLVCFMDLGTNFFELPGTTVIKTLTVTLKEYCGESYEMMSGNVEMVVVKPPSENQ